MIDAYKEPLFTYTNPHEFEGLRKTLSKNFRQDQIFTSENDMIITVDTYQTLYTLTKMPFPNRNSTMLVEQLTYSDMPH